jgi:hypothetical protein
MFNPYGVGWSWGCRVFATDIQSLRDIFSFAAASYLSLRVQLHQFESAFKFAHLLNEQLHIFPRFIQARLRKYAIIVSEEIVSQPFHRAGNGRGANR